MINAISDKQKEIIEAAAKILSTSGAAGLTIKKLAHEMNFSEGALYRHFKSKDEIILTLLYVFSVIMERKFKEAIAQHSSPEDQFKQMLDNLLKFFKNKPHFVSALFSDGLLGENEQINNAIFNLIEVMNTHLSQIIKNGQHKRVFTHDVSTEDLSSVVIGTFKLHLLKWKQAEFQFDINKSGNKMIQSLLTLIKIN